MGILDKLSYGDMRELRALERKAHGWNEDECNRDVSGAVITRRANIVERDIKRIFGEVPAGFFYNGDPRGYALKIDPEKGSIEGLERDWGGYGILSREA